MNERQLRAIRVKIQDRLHAVQKIAFESTHTTNQKVQTISNMTDTFDAIVLLRVRFMLYLKGSRFVECGRRHRNNNLVC